MIQASSLSCTTTTESQMPHDTLSNGTYPENSHNTPANRPINPTNQRNNETVSQTNKPIEPTKPNNQQTNQPFNQLTGLLNQSTNKPTNKKTVVNQQTKSLTEYPISTAKLLGRNIPIAGGGYFRLFPYWFTKMLLKRINQQEKQPFIFYLHPWEVDPEQPRIKNAKLLSKFRHYNNLNKTVSRLEQLLSEFKFGPVSG